MKYNFIIPYRNRKEHLDEFIKRFTEMLKNREIDAEFYVIHQMDCNEFNRGAMKNIGFLEVCKIRPDGLFIFHDVDTYPQYWGSIIYETKVGQIRTPIKNKYDVPLNLGCICCFWKNEFEKINGFPNYWGWGIEDNTIVMRTRHFNLTIDNSNGIDIDDSSKCYNPRHYRPPKNYETAQINTDLYNKELLTKDMSNGLSSIEYKVLSSFELAPRFTIINVEFNLINEQ
jgi:beta-1,4-galactosyltransferase 1